MWQYILTILIGLAAACYIGHKAFRTLRKLHRGETPCSCCRNNCGRKRDLPHGKCDKGQD